MEFLPQIIFLILLLGASLLFVRNMLRIRRNILMGQKVDRSDHASERWKNMIRVALGQSKMTVRPIAGILHILVYVGFLLINIELLEIVLDGLLGTHRVFAPYLGAAYNFLIAAFEVLALLVLLAVIVFWVRRNVLRLQRFWKPEMKKWPKRDADYILYFEVVLMLLFLSMNATDLLLQQQNHPGYVQAGVFPVSQSLAPLFSGMSSSMLVLFERSFWWLHIIGIFTFLNYLYYSKHLHILLAFPNTYFFNRKPKGAFGIDQTIATEVKRMLGIAVSEVSNEIPPEKFGASDVFDLNWVQLMNAYSCTECGRCTDACPANMTGKKLSPRKIMMDTRDRLETVGKHLNKNRGTFKSDGKQLLNDHISSEEIWACTSCNACVEACPIDIDPLSIIMELRKYLVMEQSAAPSDLNKMMTNMENNGAPWPFNAQDRLLWQET